MASSPPRHFYKKLSRVSIHRFIRNSFQVLFNNGVIPHVNYPTVPGSIVKAGSWTWGSSSVIGASRRYLEFKRGASSPCLAPRIPHFPRHSAALLVSTTSFSASICHPIPPMSFLRLVLRHPSQLALVWLSSSAWRTSAMPLSTFPILGILLINATLSRTRSWFVFSVPSHLIPLSSYLSELALHQCV